MELLQKPYITINNSNDTPKYNLEISNDIPEYAVNRILEENPNAVLIDKNNANTNESNNKSGDGSTNILVINNFGQ